MGGGLKNYLTTTAKGRLPKAVRFLKPPAHPSAPDWPFINWKFRLVQSQLWPLFGAHPEIAKKQGLVRIARGWGLGDIDLIPADNCVKTGSAPQGGGQPKGRGSKALSSAKRDSSREEAKARKLERAKARQEKLPRCGREGHMAFVEEEPKPEAGREELGLEARFFPHRCHSIFCPYCAREGFKETFGRLLPTLEALAQNGRLTFITLTLRNSRVESYEDVEACVEGAFRALRRLFEFRLFGKRNWARVVKAVEEELEAYYQNAKELYGEVEARKRVARQRAFWEDFVARYGELVGDSSFRFHQLGNWVVKFELTYNAERQELHPHWHIISDTKLPKVFLTAVWKLLTGSEIVDVRAVSSVREASVELSKYITKGWEFPEEAGDVKLWVEAVMHGRRKFRVWGFEMLELDRSAEKEKPKVAVAWWLKVELVRRKNLHDVPRLARRMKRKGIKEAVIDDVLIYDSSSGMVWRAQLVLTADERLVIRSRDPAFWQAMWWHYETALLFGAPPETAEDLSEIEF